MPLPVLPCSSGKLRYLSLCVSAILDGDAKLAERMNGGLNHKANVGTTIISGLLNPLHECQKLLLRAAGVIFPDARASVQICISNSDKSSIET